jgi:hypothetical protein
LSLFLCRVILGCAVFRFATPESRKVPVMYLEPVVFAAVTVLAITGLFMLRAWVQKLADRSENMRVFMICITLIPTVILLLYGVTMIAVELYSLP